MYWIYLERRSQLEDRRDEGQMQTFNLFPERWQQLYQEQILGVAPGEGEEGEIPVDDVDLLDQWYEQVANGQPSSMTGADNPSGTGEYWSEWR